MYYKHAIWKAFSGAALVVLGASPTVVLGWDTMLLSGKIVACMGIAVSVIKALDLFFDQTLARLDAGKPPVPLPNVRDTAFMQKPPEPGK